MAVTIYRSTDAGAPALPAAGNYLGANFYISLLKACLVTGYGSKAGAGWSTIYDDTTTGKRRAAFSNGNGVLELITWGNTSVGMCMWDSITTAGSGRLYDDSFATVMSAGLNGWKSHLAPAPGVNTDQMMGINLNQINSSYAAGIAWTVYADDKSAWILFHYPAGHASAAAANAITTNSAQHPQIFIGALKSPDLDRDQSGNFFVFYTARSASSTNGAPGTGFDVITYAWGLRTPFNTLPTVGNSSQFSFISWTNSTGNYGANPYSSVRLLPPMIVTYIGADVLKAAAQTTANGHYSLATLPGIAQFNEAGNGTLQGFWVFCNTLRSASWNQETYTLSGVDWMPLKLQAALPNLAITDDVSWWS
jgi:hypothetical protein